ncbi:MAG: hypothetical protein PHW04_07060 [Candidatus Wallbacteria bacterium]|nr:hypothetical protein [Candidatus Wallbacteria bacterium]
MEQSGIIQWLMQGDPAVRWQVMRDLQNAPSEVYEQERARVASCGWGNDLLSHQDENGMFGGGIYTPKWTSTHYSLLLLAGLGLAPGNEQALKSCNLLMERNYGKDGVESFGKNLRHNDDCVTGMLLYMFCYFGFKDERVHRLAEQLLSVQMQDCGWNCRSRRNRNTVHSSFHTTLNVMEGLLQYEIRYPERAAAARKARLEGMEFMLRHKLYQSHKTGKPAHPKMIMMSFPARWKFDFLRGLDFFRECKAEKDDRLSDAVGLLIEKRLPDGTWPVQNRWPGKEYFTLEQTGKPSRINTLRALRILSWWEG